LASTVLRGIGRIRAGMAICIKDLHVLDNSMVELYRGDQLCVFSSMVLDRHATIALRDTVVVDRWHRDLIVGCRSHGKRLPSTELLEVRAAFGDYP
jgi:hypothetical protein